MDAEKPLNGCWTCGCDCSAPLERMAPAPLPEDADRLKWWLEHARKQTARLWELLQGYLDEEAQAAVLIQLGRNCAENIGWAKRFIGDPDGFFNFMYGRCGETITYDREAKVITVKTRERDCDCLLVNSGNIAPVYCNCSIGWQQYTYETILNKKVDVKVVKAVIRGGRQCVFRITVQDDI